MYATIKIEQIINIRLKTISKKQTGRWEYFKEDFMSLTYFLRAHVTMGTLSPHGYMRFQMEWREFVPRLAAVSNPSTSWRLPCSAVGGTLNRVHSVLPWKWRGTGLRKSCRIGLNGSIDHIHEAAIFQWCHTEQCLLKYAWKWLNGRALLEQQPLFSTSFHFQVLRLFMISLTILGWPNILFYPNMSFVLM